MVLSVDIITKGMEFNDIIYFFFKMKGTKIKQLLQVILNEYIPKKKLVN